MSVEKKTSNKKAKKCIKLVVFDERFIIQC